MSSNEFFSTTNGYFTSTISKLSTIKPVLILYYITQKMATELLWLRDRVIFSFFLNILLMCFQNAVLEIMNALETLSS